jgi:hypothetical protein
LFENPQLPQDARSTEYKIVIENLERNPDASNDLTGELEIRLLN